MSKKKQVNPVNEAGIRNQYAKLGVAEYYQVFGNEYQNPHEAIIAQLITAHYQPTDTKVLDLCCGSGEVSRVLALLGVAHITGCDPYTHQLYQGRTGNPCLTLSFHDLATQGLPEPFDAVFCSFALHLCEDSLLPQVLYQLAVSTKRLVILTPHKRPEINQFFHLTQEIRHQKVRYRVYESLLISA